MGSKDARMAEMRRDPDCTMCKLHKTAQYVCLLGKGPTPCDIMIIGEAPGRREDDSGTPFVGKAGQLLEQLLNEYGFERESIFITNAVSCRPPDNRTPSKAEIKACRSWLDYQMKFVKPKFVLILGATAYQSITGKTGIKKARGRPFELDGVVYIPTYHPAAALYDNVMEAPIKADIQLFQNIIKRGGIPREDALKPTSVQNEEDFQKLLKAMSGVVSFDIETTGLYPWEEGAAITQIGFGTKRGEFMLPMVHPESPWRQDQIKEMLSYIDERIQNCIVVTHMGKFDYLWMMVHCDLWWNHHADFDTGLAHYALDENSFHGLKELARQFCGAPDWDIDDDTKKGQKGLEKLTLYHAHDLYYTRQLYYIFKEKLKEDFEVERVFNHILMPCLRLFSEVEYDGNCIDHTKFDQAEEYLIGEIESADKALEKYADKDEEGNVTTNWGSTKQLAKILFDDLNIQPVEKTNGGSNSTSESVLKRIDHPIAGLLIKRRGAKQQLSFFIDGWKPYIVKKEVNGIESWFIHPSFKLHGTVTGRLSSEHPNWQQIPRDPRIRQLVTAPPGWTLIEVDLEQIELKVAAELSQDPALVEAFHNGIDVHWLTMITEIERGGGQAELVLDTARKHTQNNRIKYAEAVEIVFKMGVDAAVEINPQWKELRKKAKAINFGYLFGMWWKKFKIYARDNYDIVVTDKEAQDSRKSFFAKYKLEDWHKRQRRYARRNGYVKSLSGRKRRLPDAMSDEDTPARGEAERQAINSPVQSFANEINLMSALQLRKEFPRSKVRVVATVHDAILAWVKNEYIEVVVERLLKIMSRPELFEIFEIEFGVPITAEAKIGPWSKGISFDKWKRQQNEIQNKTIHNKRVA